MHRCKTCINAYQRDYSQRDRVVFLARKRAESRRNSRTRRNTTLSRTYGITLAQYEEMLDRQGGVCAICRGPQVAHFNFLAVDHCHSSGKVRGLLCNKCNKGIGLLGHNQDTLIAAMRYLAASE